MIELFRLNQPKSRALNTRLAPANRRTAVRHIGCARNAQRFAAIAPAPAAFRCDRLRHRVGGAQSCRNCGMLCIGNRGFFMLSGLALVAVVIVFLWTRSDIGLLRERLEKLQRE